MFADREQPWRQRVESLGLELRARLAAHPPAVPLMITGPMDGPHARALNERLLEFLADAGLNPTDAPGALPPDRLRDRLDRPGSRRPAPAPPAATRIRTHGQPATAPSPQYRPAATPVPPQPRPPLASYISTEQYLWGLHRILDGITMNTTASPDAPSSPRTED